MAQKVIIVGNPNTKIAEIIAEKGLDIEFITQEESKFLLPDQTLYVASPDTELEKVVKELKYPPKQHKSKFF